ncbi:MAG: hypothetical protein RIC55_13300 [Pirellulaceae bacterium]
MRRHALGIIALLMIITGGVLLLRFGNNNTDWSMTASILLRAGLTMGAVWLAFPQVASLLTKTPRWLLICSVVGMATLVVRPRAILYVGPVLAALAALQFVGYLFTPLKQKPKQGGKRKQRKANAPRRGKGDDKGAPADPSQDPAATPSKSRSES